MSMSVTVIWIEGDMIHSGTRETPPEYEDDELISVMDDKDNDITKEALDLFEDHMLIHGSDLRVRILADLVSLGYED